MNKIVSPKPKCPVCGGDLYMQECLNMGNEVEGDEIQIVLACTKCPYQYEFNQNDEECWRKQK